MKLDPVEPLAGPWRVTLICDLVRLLFDADRTRDRRPWILAVDGRSGSGKSTVAALLHRFVAGSAIVHTDDVAWHHSFFGWSDLLVEGILKPLARNGGTKEASDFWREWQVQEIDFLQRQRPWERAKVIVNGTPTQPYDQNTEILLAPALH